VDLIKELMIDGRELPNYYQL